MAEMEAGTQGSHRLGRPPGDPESIRRKRVVTLVTDAEFEKLARIADEEEKSLSAMVHHIMGWFTCVHMYAPQKAVIGGSDRQRLIEEIK